MSISCYVQKVLLQLIHFDSYLYEIYGYLRTICVYLVHPRWLNITADLYYVIAISPTVYCIWPIFEIWKLFKGGKMLKIGTNFGYLNKFWIPGKVLEIWNKITVEGWDKRKSGTKWCTVLPRSQSNALNFPTPKISHQRYIFWHGRLILAPPKSLFLPHFFGKFPSKSTRLAVFCTLFLISAPFFKKSLFLPPRGGVDAKIYTSVLGYNFAITWTSWIQFLKF